MLQRSDGGNCVALVVGGAPESLYSRPGRKIRLFLKRRFGFIKLALQTGASVRVSDRKSENVFGRGHPTFSCPRFFIRRASTIRSR